MDKYTVYISVRIQQTDGYGGGGMEIREEATIGAQTFLEIAGILVEFHNLSEKLKTEKGV